MTLESFLTITSLTSVFEYQICKSLFDTSVRPSNNMTDYYAGSTLSLHSVSRMSRKPGQLDDLQSVSSLKTYPGLDG